MQLRKADKKDTKDIQRLLKSDKESYFLASPVDTSALSHLNIHTLLRELDCYVYVNAKNHLFGLIQLTRAKHNVPHVVSICSVMIHPEHRRQGHGVAMMKAFIEYVERGGSKQNEFKKIVRIEILIDTLNDVLQRTLLKSGFNYEVILRNIFRNASNDTTLKWYKDGMYMAKIVGKPKLITYPRTVDAYPFVENNNMPSQYIDIDVAKESGVYNFRVNDKRTNEKYLSFRCEHILECPEVAVVTSMSLECAQLSVKAYASFLKKCQFQLYRLGVRHLEIHLLISDVKLAPVITAAGFEKKGELIAKRQTAHGYEPLQVYEIRFFNFENVLEYISIENRYSDYAGIDLLVATLKTLNEWLLMQPLGQFLSFHLANDIYSLLEAIAVKPNPIFSSPTMTKSELIDRMNQQLNPWMKYALIDKVHNVSAIFTKLIFILIDIYKPTPIPLAPTMFGLPARKQAIIPAAPTLKESKHIKAAY